MGQLHCINLPVVGSVPVAVGVAVLLYRDSLFTVVYSLAWTLSLNLNTSKFPWKLVEGSVPGFLGVVIRCNLLEVCTSRTEN